MIDFAAVASSVLARAEELVPSWLPQGKRRGHEWVCGDLSGAPGESCSINLMTGKWADFSGDAKGGDLISLFAAIHGISQADAARELDDGYKPVNGNGFYRFQDEEALAEQATYQRPPNANFNLDLFKHHKDGKPSAIWVYRDAEGPLHVVARYDTDKGKQIRPWIWTGLRWQCKGPPKPRKLYGPTQFSPIWNLVFYFQYSL